MAITGQEEDNAELVRIGGPKQVDITKELDQDHGIVNRDLELEMENLSFLGNEKHVTTDKDATLQEAIVPKQNNDGLQPTTNMQSDVSITTNKDTTSTTGTTGRSAIVGITPSTPTSAKGNLKTTRHILKCNYPSFPQNYGCKIWRKICVKKNLVAQISEIDIFIATT